EVKALRGKQVGDTIDIDMASSDIGGLFADIATKGSAGVDVGGAIPAPQALKRWDELADDDLIEVYHATTPELAERFSREGVRAGQKEFGAHATRLTGDGLYVGDDPDRLRFLFGGQGPESPGTAIGITVRKGDIVNSPEGISLGDDIQQALKDPTVGGVIDKDIPAASIRILDEDAINALASPAAAPTGGGGGGGGWRYEFAPDTRAAFNELNQIEPGRAARAGVEGGGEFFVSGRFTIESIDEANKVVKLKDQQNILPHAPPPARTKRVLKGYEELVAAGAMPTRVIKNVVNNHFETVDDARYFVELIGKGKQAFRTMRALPLEGKMTPDA